MEPGGPLRYFPGSGPIEESRHFPVRTVEKAQNGTNCLECPVSLALATCCLSIQATGYLRSPTQVPPPILGTLPNTYRYLVRTGTSDHCG